MWLSSGEPAVGAHVRLFDLTDLRSPPLVATTDGSGRFTLPLATLSGVLPERFELGANYPNPFNPSTLIPYQLPASMPVRLEVFNLLGQRIAMLVDGEQPAGFHTAVWDATDAAGQAVAAGVYLYRLSGEGTKTTRRMLLIDGHGGFHPGGRGLPAREDESAAGEGEEAAPVYGLTVSDPGLVPYVNPAFQVKAGMAPLEVVVEAPDSLPAAKAVSSGGILGDVDNTGRVDFSDALLVALYSRDPGILLPNDGDISLGDVNADAIVDFVDASHIVAFLYDPSSPVLPSGIGEPVGPAVALSPDPSTVAFADDAVWHRFTVEADEPVSVVANPEGTTPRLEITTRSGRGNACPAETDDDQSREDGEAIYLSGCAAGEATVELRREADGTVLQTYTFEVAGSPADLVVASVSVSDSTLTVEQSFTLNATVRNQGTGASAATTLRWYRSTNATISTRDTLAGTDAVGALAAAGTSAESIRLTAPSGAGTWYYGACVAGGAGESVGNNCSRGVRVRVEAPSPDLVVESVSVSDSSVTAGQSFTLSATVRNQGTGEAAAPTLHWYRSTDATISNRDTEVGTDAMGALAAAGTRADSINLTAPSSAGTWYYGACVAGGADESAGNNCSRGVRVRVEALSPDLVVESVSVSDSSLVPRQSFTLTATVRNQGTGEAAAPTLHWYRSTDATISNRDTEVDTDAMGALAAAGTRADSINLTAPSSAGTWYYGACVAGGADESAGNNCSRGVRVRVEALSPDLVVESVSVSDSSVTAGQSFTLTATVRNQGMGEAAAPTLHWYRSTDATISNRDTEVDTDAMGALAAAGTRAESIQLTASFRGGTYYYGTCVVSVGGDSSGNNCSGGIRVVVEDDFDALLDGVGEIGAPGSPGPLSVYGPNAFPVIVGGSTNRVRAPVVAAARWQAGRVVAWGHDGYFERATLETADVGRMMRNALRWAAGGRADPRIGVAGSLAENQLRGWLAEAGHDADETALTPESLGRVDVVAVGLWNQTAAEIEALAEFVQAGGGLVTASTGWGWAQLHPDQDLVTDYPGNRLLAPVGILWAFDWLVPTSSRGYLVDGPPSELTHAGRALDAVEASAAGLTPSEIEQALDTLVRTLRHLPANDTLLAPRLQALVEDNDRWPSAEEPVGTTDVVPRLAATLFVGMQKRTPPESVRAHPAAADFPGLVPADAPRFTRTLTLDTTEPRGTFTGLYSWPHVPRWHSTGLYAAPGELVTVTVPSRVARAGGFQVCVGAHSGDISAREEWTRMPVISRRFPVSAATTRIANAFGGLIYVEVPVDADLGKIPVTIEGAVAAPLFVLGETDLATWRDEIRHAPAPWAEIAGRNMIVTTDAREVRGLDDPAAVARTWDRILDLNADLAAWPSSARLRPERFVVDRQISVGWMHAGYPITAPLYHQAKMVNVRHLRSPVGWEEMDSNWGMFHEVGHNHQSSDWTFEGTVEVTVNLFTLYVFEFLCGTPATSAYHEWAGDHTRAKIERYDFKNPDFELWKREPGLALFMYVQLQEAFGWDAFKQVFATYRALPDAERPNSDDEKRDQWLVRFSRQVGRNLGPFFEAWGVPTSRRARASVADLPVWMPAGSE